MDLLSDLKEVWGYDPVRAEEVYRSYWQARKEGSALFKQWITVKVLQNKKESTDGHVEGIEESVVRRSETSGGDI